MAAEDEDGGNQSVGHVEIYCKQGLLTPERKGRGPGRNYREGREMVKSARGGDGDSGKSRGGEAEWTQKIEVKRGEGEWGSRLGSKKPGNTARHDQAVYRRTEGNDPRKNIAGVYFLYFKLKV